jgi:hypothetical protein
MKIVATQKGGELLSEDLETRSRQIGLMVVANVSGTIQINLTEDEAEDFERVSERQIDSDVMPDEVVDELLKFLSNEGLLENSDA